MSFAIEILTWLFTVISILVSPFVFVALLVFISVLLNLFYYVIIKRNKIPKKIGTIKKYSKTYRLLVQFPRRFVWDKIESNPNAMKLHGLHLYCGRQGSGKTITLIHDLMNYQEQYPLVKVYTNLDYKYQDGELVNGADIINVQNGEEGIICVVDELQNWFSSLESRNFPPELITEICQQRKSRKAILGTTQVYSRVAKAIREQVLFVHVPKTFFGCLTVVRTTLPEYWNDDKQRFEKFIKTRFFVHTVEIRNAFDTYKKIEKMTFDRTLLNIENNKE